MAALYYYYYYLLLYLTSKGAIFLSLLYKISHTFRCKFMGRFCFFIALCSFLDFYNNKRLFFRLPFLWVFFMDCASCFKILLSKYTDFGCGFLIFGCFSRFLEVFVVFFMFILGFLLLHFHKSCKFWGKLKVNDEIASGSSSICAKNDDLSSLKKLGFECGTTKVVPRVLEKNRSGPHQKVEEIEELVGSNDEESEECCDADQMFDVMTLRKMVKAQRRKLCAVNSELEKERMAASSSVDEAMAMILRLQNDKSVLQMQANQLQRAAEEKQLHDHDVIQSLQWIVMKHESERSILEDQLRMCREKLKVFMKGEEWSQFDGVCPTPSASHCSFESRFDDDLHIGALNFDSSPI